MYGFDICSFDPNRTQFGALLKTLQVLPRVTFGGHLATKLEPLSSIASILAPFSGAHFRSPSVRIPGEGEGTPGKT